LGFHFDIVPRVGEERNGASVLPMKKKRPTTGTWRVSEPAADDVKSSSPEQTFEVSWVTRLRQQRVAAT
jgi:hypothetical protein